MPESIFSNEHVYALYDDRDGDTLLITFNEMTAAARGTNYWGDHVAGKLGLSAIGFMSKHPNWFPASAMTHLGIIRSLAKRYRYVITYGFSQGGYAALKYARQLGATHALAFSPQTSINPADVAFDRRFSKYFDPALHSEMLLTPADLPEHSTIFIDRRERGDLEHATRLKSRAALVTIPFVGHGTVRVVASAELLGSLLSLAQQNADALAFSSLLNRAKRKTPFYFATLSTICHKRGRRDLAFRILDLGMSRFPTNSHLQAVASQLANAT